MDERRQLFEQLQIKLENLLVSLGTLREGRRVSKDNVVKQKKLLSQRKAQLKDARDALNNFEAIFPEAFANKIRGQRLTPQSIEKLRAEWHTVMLESCQEKYKLAQQALEVARFIYDGADESWQNYENLVITYENAAQATRQQIADLMK